MYRYVQRTDKKHKLKATDISFNAVTFFDDHLRWFPMCCTFADIMAAVINFEKFNIYFCISPYNPYENNLLCDLIM